MPTLSDVIGVGDAVAPGAAAFGAAAAAVAGVVLAALGVGDAARAVSVALGVDQPARIVSVACGVGDAAAAVAVTVGVGVGVGLAAFVCGASAAVHTPNTRKINPKYFFIPSPFSRIFQSAIIVLFARRKQSEKKCKGQNARVLFFPTCSISGAMRSTT